MMYYFPSKVCIIGCILTPSVIGIETQPTLYHLSPPFHAGCSPKLIQIVIHIPSAAFIVHVIWNSGTGKNIHLLLEFV